MLDIDNQEEKESLDLELSKIEHLEDSVKRNERYSHDREDEERQEIE